jgi:hypothetical protein
MFRSIDITEALTSRGRAQALEAWRDAAALVRTRWQLFLNAGPEGRAWAFASYIAALDAEESAAADMARLRWPVAA